MVRNPYPLDESQPFNNAIQAPTRSNDIGPLTANSMIAQNGEPIISGEPRTTEDFPANYQSFLPHLAISKMPPTNSQLPESASVNRPYTTSIYSVSQRVDQRPTEARYPQNETRPLSNDMNSLPAQPIYGASRSDKKLTRISAYDYMLH
ncbi:hypothetical protein Tcan_11783 [Toxocara canis]|nr:hypothetical protein Tcan_11783 [Toxocara canis]